MTMVACKLPEAAMLPRAHGIANDGVLAKACAFGAFAAGSTGSSPPLQFSAWPRAEIPGEPFA